MSQGDEHVSREYVRQLRADLDRAIARIAKLELRLNGEPARGPAVPAEGGIESRLEELEVVFDAKCRRHGTGRYRCQRKAQHDGDGCEQNT